MDTEYFRILWNILLTGIVMLLGWIWNGLNKRLDDMNNHHSKVAEQNSREQHEIQKTVTAIQINYVHKNELREMKTELLTRFDRLEDLVTKRANE